MKNSFKILAVLALGASAIFLHSCTEVEEPEPAVPVCYMSTLVDDGDTTTYIYNSDNQIVQSVYDGDTVIYEYSGGRLSTIVDGLLESTFIYDAGNLPSRINNKFDGIDAGYIIVESSGGNITKVEIHDETGQATEVTNVTYTDGKISSLIADEWNADSSEFETTAQITNIMTDGKKNPYQTSLALIMANYDNPLAYGTDNMVSGDLDFDGQSVPVVVTHTYNANDYPENTNLTILGFPVSTSYTFDCK
jgi:hypothetical protein